jgi:hypothetical protein
MEEQNRRIRIPYLETGGDNPSTCVELFPDELPLSTDLDHNDLVDCLRSELAPLHVWRSCAVEYHRQGCHFEFEAILNEIVESLLDEQGNAYLQMCKCANVQMRECANVHVCKCACLYVCMYVHDASPTYNVLIHTFY